MATFSRQTLSDAALIVIKIGTSSLTDSTGRLDSRLFKKLSKEISYLIKDLGKKVIVVTSGAIAAGSQKLSHKGSLKTIEEKQAAAAIGQPLLMKEYEKNFASFGITVSQVLLTRDAIENFQRRINSRNTIRQILKFKAIPIINENDTVSVDEIKFGDNDTLSALVADLADADLLVILSNVEGFIKDRTVLSEINKITKEVEKAAKGSDSSFGIGGMQTKLRAAAIAGNAGIPLVIALSKEKDVVKRILSGENIGTLFIPKSHKK
ncbi:MAG: glutamate 5-kinase [Candidatus Saganbacteria bacterium]|nr:glutamate 5-kinase [Candidatus Saganbacteria bacterium]